MYAEYAKDPRMKINVGIRRRLAPLLDGGRDEIELMHAILFSLPGSPVLYYGDEIAMGDNVYLGDRDGVRTPMQWTGDRNGGFSRADFAQLYAPPLMDPVYGYQAVNVEAQLRTPTSLLRWMRRFISLRKEHPVFGLGTYEPLTPSNPRIFAHVRRYEDDVMLCVHNLARSAQAVELDLSRVRGPLPGRDVRPLALPAHRRAAVPADARAARLLLVPARRAETRRPTTDVIDLSLDSPRRRCTSGSSPSAGSAPRRARSRSIDVARGVHAARGRRRSSCSRWSRRASARGRTRSTRCRSACGRPTRAGTSGVIAEADGWTVYDALADPAHAPRAAAPDARRRRRAGRRGRRSRFRWARSGGAEPARHGRRAAGRRRAVELVDRLRRGADPEGVPARRAGRQPGARAAALPVRRAASRTSRRWPAGTSTRAG